MYNLIPHFIYDEYQANHLSGDVMVATMFMDMSGFTHMTETLMQYGKAGAEILADILERVFQPIIHAVYENGGYIAGFAGDAFMAVFPADNPIAVCLTAKIIRESSIRQACQQTSHGDFSFSVKMGLSYGKVEWGIIGPENHRTYFYRGAGIDGCTQAENMAESGDIILDHNLQTHLPLDTMEFQSRTLEIDLINENYAKLITLHDTNLPKQNFPAPYASLPTDFFSESLLNATQKGEFRDVVSVFISFQANMDTVEKLDMFVTHVIETVDDFGGYFNRLDFGDKGGNILIFFGAPTAYENNIGRALNFISTLKEDMTSCENMLALKWRAGIAYGSMYAGMVGIPLRCEYTTLGTAVNLSARLMMKAEWGQFLTHASVISETMFLFEHIGDFLYKGLQNPISTYVLLGRNIVEKTIFEKTMIGRQGELHRLMTAALPIFPNGHAGKFAGFAYVYGEAGIGKSRLCYEFEQLMKTHNTTQPVSWFQAETDEILQQPFNPFVYFLKYYFNQSANNTLAENKAIFEKHFNELSNKASFVSHGASELALTAHKLIDELIRTKSILGALLGLYWSDSLYERLDGKGRYNNTIAAIKNLLLIESCRQPVIFHLEDSHWLDTASHELITNLTDDTDDYPIFIVTTSRYADDGSKPRLNIPEDTPVTTIDLQYLSESDLRTLAETHLEGNVDDMLYGILLEKSEANPFYAQQYLYYFKENDLIYQNGHDIPSTWTLKESAMIQLPTTINGMLIARIDRLERNIKEVVKVASVLGREFETRILSEVLRMDVETMIQGAIDEQMWSALSDVRYIFKHALLRDAAYRMQLNSRLRELHQLTAEAYELIFADNLVPHYADLFHHWHNTDNKTKEFHYARLAGDESMRTYANDDAIKYYRRALALATESQNFILGSDDYIYLHTNLGRVLELNGYFKEAFAVYEKLEQLGHTQNDDKIRLQGLIRQGQLRSTVTPMANHEEGQIILDQALELAHVLQNKEAEATILWCFQNLRRMSDDLDSAIMYGIQSLKLARKLNIPERIAFPLNDLGYCYNTTGKFDKAIEVLHEASMIWKQIGNLPMLTDSLGGLCMLYTNMGCFDKAIAYSQESMQISESINNEWGKSYAQSAVSLAYLHLGHISQGITIAKNSIRAAKKVDFYVGKLIGHVYLGKLYASLGAIEKGIAVVEAIIDESLEQIPVFKGVALANLGELHVLMENHEQAKECITESKELIKTEGNQNFTMLTVLPDIQLQITLKNYAVANSIADEYLPDLRHDNIRPFLVDVLYLKAQALLGMSNIEEGYHVLLDAKAIAEDINSRWMLWQILDEMAEVEIKRGNFSEAQKLRQHAKELIDYITDHITEPELRMSFHDLPKVRRVMNEQECQTKV